jgi:hypothetical protein
MKSFLVEVEALWSQTGMTGENGHNF